MTDIKAEAEEVFEQISYKHHVCFFTIYYQRKYKIYCI